jgi:porin
VSTYSPFHTIDDGDFFYAAEVGYNNTAALSGTYRLMAWHNQTPDNDGSGLAISVDQHIADNLVAFARWGFGDDKVTDFEQFISAGLGIEAPFGRADDLFAVGMAWADPSDDTLDKETIVEAFYRYQLNDLMQLTPAVQAVLDPAESTQSGTVYVFSLRLQTTW